jgi:hypothetical protein
VFRGDEASRSRLSSSHRDFPRSIAGTTVGYGDVTVSTDEGKLFLAIYAILVSFSYREKSTEHCFGFFPVEAGFGSAVRTDPIFKF